MNTPLNRETRVRAALAGDPVDRVPLGMWGHDWIREQSVDGLVAATFAMFETVGTDFVKLNPRYTYFVEDWGCTFHHHTGRPQPVDWPVRQPSDLRRLPRLDPEGGVLAEQMRVLDIVRQRLPADVPLLQTMFTPLAIVRDLMGKNEALLAEWMRTNPDDIHEGLRRVTEAFSDYCRRIVEHGAAGVFFGTTRLATYDTITAEAHDEFARPYDLALIDAASAGWFSIMHVCQDRAMLDRCADYPVAAFSWAEHQPNNPSLVAGQALTGRCVIGGLPTSLMLQGTPADVAGAVRAAIAATGGRHSMLGPSCTIDPDVPEANLRALLAAAAG